MVYTDSSSQQSRPEPPKFNSGVVDRASKADSREWFEVADCGVATCSTCTKSFDDGEVDLKRRSDFAASSRLLLRMDVEEAVLTKDHLMLLPFRVYGYVLLNRNWCRYSNFAPQIQLTSL